jgi:hypothetical protein
MDAFGIVYPQYCLQLKLETRFVSHLAILKDACCYPKKLRTNDLWVSRLLLAIFFAYIDFSLFLP